MSSQLPQGRWKAPEKQHRSPSYSRRLEARSATRTARKLAGEVEAKTEARQEARRRGQGDAAQLLDIELNGPVDRDKVVDDVLIPGVTKGLFADLRAQRAGEHATGKPDGARNYRRAPLPAPEAGRMAR